MNSTTWLVTVQRKSYVAKLVPGAARAQFEAGLAAAEHLCRRGFDAGQPVRTIDGGLCLEVQDQALGLLTFVLGRELDGRDPVDQQWWGDRLGAAHLALADFRHPGLPGWHWIRPDAGHLELEPWLRPAVARAVGLLEKLQVTDRLTFGSLHGDPYHGAFLLNPATGRIGVIDWASMVSGPLVYDLASAVMYAGGVARAADLVQSYVATGALPPAEADSALPILLRFRWAVQADHFARRMWTDPCAENQNGLHDAQKALLG